MLRTLLTIYRKDQKLSLSKLAKLIGVDRTAIHRMEAGRPISEKNWVAIVKWVVGD